VPAGDDSYSHLPNYLESEAENLEGIKLAESGNLDEALCKFNKAIEVCINVIIYLNH
jgi:Flp pilus assembly protein TadD